MTENFQKGETVRLRNNPSEAGLVTQVMNLPGGIQLALVNLTTGPRKFPFSQLEQAPKLMETPSELIRNGHLPGPTELRRQTTTPNFSCEAFGKSGRYILFYGKLRH